MLSEIKQVGIERIYTALLADTYELIQKYNLVPELVEYCTNMQEIISQLSIGQLYTLSQLGERWKGFKFLYVDQHDNTLYLQITGLYGGMDANGFIHT